MKLAILLTSVAALVLVGAGSLIMQVTGGSYPGLPFTLQAFLGGLVVELGVLVAGIAAVLCAINAYGRRDWRSFAATVLLVLLGLMGSPYLQVAIAATHRDGNTGSAAPQPVLYSIAASLIVLGLPLATLLYGLFIERRALRFGAAGGMALLTLGSLLLAAPPWAVFNPRNGAPVLAIDAPRTGADCAHGQYPPITLENTGGGTVTWRFAFAAFNAVTTSPTSGSLAPGQTQVVTLVGAYSPSADRPHEVGVEFDSDGGNQRAIISCQG